MGTQRLAHDYYSFICNSHKLETTQISINRSMDKYIVVLRNELGIHETSVQLSSVAQLCPTLCDPMNRSTPGLPVHHQLLEFTQTHVH